MSVSVYNYHRKISMNTSINSIGNSIQFPAIPQSRSRRRRANCRSNMGRRHRATALIWRDKCHGVYPLVNIQKAIEHLNMAIYS